MKTKQLRLAAIMLAATLGLTVSVWAGVKPTPQKKTAPAATNAPTVVAEVEIPKSVFNYPRSPKEGRNPFFPESRSAIEAPKPKSAIDPLVFVLNGITSPPRPTAMINGRTFEPGECGEVKMQGGSKTSITCVEIRDNAVIIKVGAERRELRLRSGI